MEQPGPHGYRRQTNGKIDRDRGNALVRTPYERYEPSFGKSSGLQEHPSGDDAEERDPSPEILFRAPARGHLNRKGIGA